MSILLYGGTFDPPHYGHINNLKAAVAVVKPDRVIIMPAGVPPHKAASHTAAALRLEMCRTAFAEPGREDPAFPPLEVSGWETEQAEKGVTNYTSITLEMLHGEYPGEQLYFAIGSDMLLTFDQWHAWQDILHMAVPVVMSREEDDAEALRKKAEELCTAAGGTFLFGTLKPLPMASSDIRKRLAQGDPCEDALAEGVRAIIAREGLYR